MGSRHQPVKPMATTTADTKATVLAGKEQARIEPASVYPNQRVSTGLGQKPLQQLLEGLFDRFAELTQCPIVAEHNISPGTLLIDRQLRRLSTLKLSRIPAALRNAGDALPSWSRHTNHRITLGIEPRFEQQRRVNDTGRRPRLSRPRPGASTSVSEPGMNQSLKPLSLTRFGEHDGTDQSTIDASVTVHHSIPPPGSHRALDLIEQENAPRLFIRVINHAPEIPQDRRDRALSSTDLTDQPKDDRALTHDRASKEASR